MSDANGTIDISVVVPLHNGAATITATLDSLLEQPGAALEVIVVDDRSTDGGPALAAAHPVRPTIVTSDGIGVSVARNTGVARASAPWVLFLDDDDLIEPRALAHRLRAAPQRDAVVVTRHALLFEDGTRRSVEPRAEADPRRMYLPSNDRVIHAHLVPRAALLTLDGPFRPGLRHLEDWEIWLRLAYSGVRFVALDLEDCLYRQRDVMTIADADAPDDALGILQRLRPSVDAAHALAWRRSRQEHTLWRATTRARHGDIVGASADLGRAVVASPRDAPAIPLLLLRKLASRRRRAPPR